MNQHTPQPLGPYLPILTDYGFKASFGNQQDTRFLRRALQALIQSDVPIKSVQFVKNDYSGASKQGRGARLDLICEDEQGQVFIVEMQVEGTKNFIQRAKHYAFHVFNQMVKKGKYQFNDLKRIYMVSFLAKSAFSSNLYHQVANLKNQQCEVVDEQITHVIVELDKFNKSLSEVKTDIDKLIYTMKQTANTNFEVVDFMRDDWLSTALKALETANLTAQQRMHLELDVAHKVAYETSLKEEGKEIGREMGKKIGKEENTYEVIVAALQEGSLSDEKIALICNVPMARVQEIRQQLS